MCKTEYFGRIVQGTKCQLSSIGKSRTGLDWKKENVMAPQYEELDKSIC